MAGICSDSVDGATPIADDETDSKKLKEIVIPSEADFLIANSTVPGKSNVNVILACAGVQY